MVSKVDQNSDGLVTFEEFVEIFGNVPNATLEGGGKSLGAQCRDRYWD